jgi:FkbM family methyltransferase
MRVDPADENGRRVYIHGLDWRERLTRHFVRLLRRGDCVIDVGANVGYFSLVAAELVGPEGSVHAFEPAPQVLPLLQENARLNPQANLQVHGAAVTDRSGQTRFYAAPRGRSGYSSIRDLGEQTSGVSSVPTVALDALLDEFPPVRLVKIDVEGAELCVLRGMRRLIARDRPFLIVELDDGFLRELGADAGQVCTLLRETGYELERIVAAGGLQPITEPPQDRCNVLAGPGHGAARSATAGSAAARRTALAVEVSA